MAFLYIILILFVGLTVYATLIEPNRLVITEHYFSSPNYMKNSVRILALSDLHISWWTPIPFLYFKWLKLWRSHRQNPYQLIILAGDYMDTSTNKIGWLKYFLCKLTRFGIPTYGVWGDHDDPRRFPDVNLCSLDDTLRDCGITMLDNQAVKLSELGLVIYGMRDLEQSSDYMPTIGKIRRVEDYKASASALVWYQDLLLNEPGVDLFRIMVSHNPDCIFLPGTPIPNLYLSGHTHGGQVIGAKKTQDLTGRLQPSGWWRNRSGKFPHSGMTLIIARGVGCSTLPIRLGSVPEALAITISPS